MTNITKQCVYINFCVTLENMATQSMKCLNPYMEKKLCAALEHLKQPEFPSKTTHGPAVHHCTMK